MKKLIALILSLSFVLALAGCNNKSMNYIIANKPSVTGIVEEVHDDYVIMYSETAEGYPNGSRWNVPLEVENQDSYTDLVSGDEIVVYYDGSAMETDPLQIATVYAITLKTPANRSTPETPNVLVPAVMYNGEVYCTTGTVSYTHLDVYKRQQANRIRSTLRALDVHVPRTGR